MRRVSQGSHKGPPFWSFWYMRAGNSSRELGVAADMGVLEVGL